MSENEDLFHIVSMNDEKAKIIAMELANDKGRMVLDAIFQGKKSSSEISKELGMSLPTVLFHIERLIETGVIKVIDTNLSKKFREIKYYGPSKKAILIIPEKEMASLENVTNGLLSGINAKLIGITGFMAAVFSGGLIKIFSDSSTPVKSDSFDVLSSPPPLEEETRNVVDAISTLPSTTEMIAIVIAAAVIAISITMVYQRVIMKRL